MEENRLMEDVAKALENVRAQCPLIHNITNYVTVNDVANIVLAVGASPIMADDIAEAGDIASIAGALVLNIGTLNARTVESMVEAGKRANQAGVPVVLDPVGAGASALRNETTPRTRRHILVGVTAALLADEAALLLGMACTGQWNWSYLPLHLCSINVFVCLYNTLTDRSWCKEELYALCIPGAALALLCPSWRDVPGWFTLINLHSVSIHALLVLYPVLLVAGGYRPSVRRVPQVLAFLFGSALPIYFLNKPLHTNFYFLNNPYGNVITSTFTAWFGEKFYILGFLPAIALALVLMYAPWVVGKRKKI